MQLIDWVVVAIVTIVICSRLNIINDNIDTTNALVRSIVNEIRPE